MVRLLVVALVLLAAPSTVVAMSICSSDVISAWSDDGRSALLERRAHGPEGGGSTRYLLVTPTGRSEFPVSSDFSPGGGSRPQRISAEQCAATLEELRAALSKAGFSEADVKVYPERCDKERSRVVLTSKTRDDHAGGGYCPPGGGKLARGDASVTAAGGDLLVEELKSGAKKTLKGAAPSAGWKAALSPSRKLLLVFAEDDFGTALEAGFGADAGIAALAPLK